MVRNALSLRAANAVRQKMSQKQNRTKTMALAAIAALVTAVIAGGSMYAFASTGSNATNAVTDSNNGSNGMVAKGKAQALEMKIKAEQIRDIRDHREDKFR